MNEYVIRYLVKVYSECGECTVQKNSIRFTASADEDIEERAKSEFENAVRRTVGDSENYCAVVSDFYMEIDHKISMLVGKEYDQKK